MTHQELLDAHRQAVRQTLEQCLAKLSRHSTYIYEGLQPINIGSTVIVFHVRTIHFNARQDAWKGISRALGTEHLTLMDCDTDAQLRLILAFENNDFIQASK
ncbi:MAG: hypothetical protein EOO39_00125 [Cytophagaceae bacterium]|nr:MAG: hypothetical protein EOO39_00125 [Cytophagaceae bacterium]